MKGGDIGSLSSLTVKVPSKGPAWQKCGKKSNKSCEMGKSHPQHRRNEKATAGLAGPTVAGVGEGKVRTRSRQLFDLQALDHHAVVARFVAVAYGHDSKAAEDARAVRISGACVGRAEQPSGAREGGEVSDQAEGSRVGVLELEMRSAEARTEIARVVEVVRADVVILDVDPGPELVAAEQVERVVPGDGDHDPVGHDVVGKILRVRLDQRIAGVQLPDLEAVVVHVPVRVAGIRIEQVP